jgi:predicted Rossmann-fold nucleotide-binding protein
VLIGTSYWTGLIQWIREQLLAQARISPPDMELFYLTDSTDEAIEHILSRYKEAGPLWEQPNKLLNIGGGGGQYAP